MNVEKLYQKVNEDYLLKDSIVKMQITYKELLIIVKKKNLLDVLIKLKEGEEYLFAVLIDICGVDFPDKDNRFTIVYQLLSLVHNQRIRVQIQVSDEDFVPSIKNIFGSAHWYEREVWDMYGILFEGNDDLRRILTDYGFSGFPMRKDFPVTGNVEIRYDIEKQKIVYEPVKLAQEFRNFDVRSPWEGHDYVLPGDEKVDNE